MIEKYFEEVEGIISYFENIRSYTLSKKIYNDKQGFIQGQIVFWDDSRLDFAEVKNIEVNQKIKYSYHYMDKDNNLVFRYDNAKHHKNIKTFPHHKHLKNRVIESYELNLFHVLLEIIKIERQVIPQSRV